MANGVFPPALDTPVGQIRVLIPDLVTADRTVNTDYMFSDDELDAFLSIYADSVRRAAAAVLDTIATNEVLTYRTIRTDDLQVDVTKGAELLRRRAQALRDEADALDDNEATDSFEIVFADGGFVPEGTPVQWGRQWTWGQWR